MWARKGSNLGPPSYNRNVISDMSEIFVGCLGIEPSTSFLSGKRSTNELAAQIKKFPSSIRRSTTEPRALSKHPQIYHKIHL